MPKRSRWSPPGCHPARHSGAGCPGRPQRALREALSLPARDYRCQADEILPEDHRARQGRTVDAVGDEVLLTLTHDGDVTQRGCESARGGHGRIAVGLLDALSERFSGSLRESTLACGRPFQPAGRATCHRGAKALELVHVWREDGVAIAVHHLGLALHHHQAVLSRGAQRGS